MANEGQIRGKQIKTGDVLLPDGSVSLTGPLNADGQKVINLGAPTDASDAARLQDIHDLNRKKKCKTVALTNITLSGEQTVNGQACVASDRVLAVNQSSPTPHYMDGIWIVASGAWSRAADASTGEELTGAVVFVDLGTTGANTNYQQVNTITTPDSEAQDWIDVGGANDGSEPTTSDKNKTAAATSGNYQTTGATIAAPPARGSYVEVQVNGLPVTVGDGVRTRACYFSVDGGTNARSFATLQAGDTLYWNGVIAGYDLTTTDRIDLLYNV